MSSRRGKAMMLVLSLGSVMNSACGTAKVEGTDCPKAEQLMTGAVVKCGGKTIAGAMLRADPPVCSKTGETGCIAGARFPAADSAVLVPENFRDGKTVAGIEGSLAPEIRGGSYSLCGSEGESNCVVAGRYAAVDTTDLAPKIVAGSTAAGIAGTGTAAPPIACANNAAVGCETNAGYPAVDQATLVRCLTGGH